jgi:hypothetical protein
MFIYMRVKSLRRHAQSMREPAQSMYMDAQKLCGAEITGFAQKSTESPANRPFPEYPFPTSAPVILLPSYYQLSAARTPQLPISSPRPVI